MELLNKTLQHETEITMLTAGDIQEIPSFCSLLQVMYKPVQLKKV